MDHRIVEKTEEINSGLPEITKTAPEGAASTAVRKLPVQEAHYFCHCQHPQMYALHPVLILADLRNIIHLIGRSEIVSEP